MTDKDKSKISSSMDDQKKKILIFATTYIPFIGGAEVAIREIIQRTPDIDFDIVTVNLDGRQKSQETIDGRTVYRIGSGMLGKLLFPLRAYLLSKRLHKVHTYDACWSMMASYAGFAGFLFSKKYSVPFILTLQEGDTKEELRKKFYFIWPLFKKMFYQAAHIQAISEYLAGFAKEVRSDAPVSVIPNGVSFGAFQRDIDNEVDTLRQELRKNPEDIYLITTSRLVKKNAVQDIVTALAYLPHNVQLLIVGDGEQRGMLEKVAESVGVAKRVMFFGEMSHESVLPYLKVSDIFIRPSLSEGFGNSFVEAMAAGLPVIATPVGGIVDFLEDRKTGLFCEVRSPESIAKQVRLLLEDTQLKRSIVDNARVMVKERYDWDLIASRMQKEVFEVVLRNELKKA